MSFHGLQIYVCIVDFLSCHAMTAPGSYSVTWKLLENVITRRSVLDFQPTLSESVQVEILSVSLTRRKSP